MRLYEKKMSEVFDVSILYPRSQILYMSTQWAIAKNKHCQCVGKGQRCQACVERIVDFEITAGD